MGDKISFHVSISIQRIKPESVHHCFDVCQSGWSCYHRVVLWWFCPKDVCLALLGLLKIGSEPM